MEIFLTEEDLVRIKKKKIGQGREGKVYDAGNGLAYKIYYKLTSGEREKIQHINVKEFEIDEDGVKKVKNTTNRVNIESFIPSRNFYIDRDGVKKIYSISQIREAQIKQPNVKKTSLPLGPIYINNLLWGVVLKRHKGYFNIHSMSFFPTSWRIKVLRKVLDNLKELCDNNIYPVDFADQSEGSHPHSNIIVNMKGDAQFIDLEGKSTMYTKEFNRQYYLKAYSEFYSLFLILIYDEKLPDEYEEEDVSYMERSLERKGLNKEHLRHLRNWSDLSYETLSEMLDSYELEAKNKTR